MKKPKKLKKLIKGAKMGKPPAMYRLGLCYYSGSKVPEDKDRAVELIMAAAQKRYMLADEWMDDYVFSNEKLLEEELRIYNDERRNSREDLDKPPDGKGQHVV